MLLKPFKIPENFHILCGMPRVLLIQSIYRRHDLTDGLKLLQCKTLIFVGERSEFHAEAVYMSGKMGRKSCVLVEVACCSHRFPFLTMSFFLSVKK